MNGEIMRRIQRRDQALEEPVIHSATQDIGVTSAMRNRTATTEDHTVGTPDSHSEEAEDNENDLKIHKSRRVRRSPRIAGDAPQYSGLYCSLEDPVLDAEEVYNVIHRDNCFLSTVDPNSTGTSPATRYLDRTNYLSEFGLVGEVHPYAFSAKVQTHIADSPTYKDILRLPEEERKLWDVAMIKELKSLRDLGSFKMVSRPRGANILASTWAFKKKRFPDGALKKYKARFCVRGDQ